MYFLFTLVVVLAFMLWRLSRRVAQGDRRWAELVGRVYALEQEIKELVKLKARGTIFDRELATPEELSPEKQPRREVVSIEEEISAKPSKVPSAVSPPIPPRTPPLPPQAPAAVFARSAESDRAPTGLPPSLTPASSAPSVVERLASIRNLEEVLGTNWLNKLGVIILVFGVAFFLAYQVRTLGPAGKIATGCLVAVVMLGAGVFYERRERWRILARAAIGGGWALLFFTAYAMHHIEASRIISSQVADLVLLLVVAAVMVAHTLKYRSQVVTGLAFLLAFSTITISHVNAYSLTAGAILALGLVVIVARQRWYQLEVFGILATFINQYWWLRPIIEPMGAHHGEFPGYRVSSALLTGYWLLYRCSYAFRRVVEKLEENLSTVAAILNTGLYLWVMGYQSAHPELAFQFFLTVGAVELAFGQWLRSRRRGAFVILTVMGAVLLVAAFPYRYSGSSLSVLWLAEAEAFFLAGVLLREIVFRRLGLLAMLLVSGQMLSVDAAQVMGRRWDGAIVDHEWSVAVVFALAAAFFYADAHVAPRLWQDSIQGEFETLCIRRLSGLAAVMALVGLWVAWPKEWTAVAWSALALTLAFLGGRVKLRELLVQAGLAAAAVTVRALLVNLGSTGIGHHVSSRLLTVGLCGGMLYLASRWAGVPEFVRVRRLSSGYTWAASTLVTLLAWYELRPISVAPAWALFGLVLFELGLERRSWHLRLQAYFALVSSFIRLFFVNVNAEGQPGELSPRVYTLLPMAVVFFYVYWRLQGREEEFLERDQRLRAALGFSFLSTLTLAALMRFELPPDWVVAAWAALVLVLVLVAWRMERRVFLAQALFFGFAVLFRTVLHNFYERSYFPAPFWQSRPVCVSATVGLLFLALPFAFQLARQPEAVERAGGGWLSKTAAGIDRAPEQVFFFVPFALLTVLLALEMRSGMVTVAWGLEAVGVFVFALWVGKRSFRLAGLGLLLLCVGKIVFVDVWAMLLRDRYLTFIVLGVALITVSTLYTRYRETLRQYL